MAKKKIEYDSFSVNRIYESLERREAGDTIIIRGTVYTPLGAVQVWGEKWERRNFSCFDYCYKGRVYRKTYHNRFFTVLGFTRMATQYAREVMNCADSHGNKRWGWGNKNQKSK